MPLGCGVRLSLIRRARSFLAGVVGTAGPAPGLCAARTRFCPWTDRPCRPRIPPARRGWAAFRWNPIRVPAGVSCEGREFVHKVMKKDSFAEARLEADVCARMSWRLDPTTMRVARHRRARTSRARDDGTRRRSSSAWPTRSGWRGSSGLPVFHTEQAPEKLGPTVAPIRDALGSGCTAAPGCGWSFPRRVVSTPGELPPTLLVAGIETHVCVRQTVFDLRERGHAVLFAGGCGEFAFGNGPPARSARIA